jgi:hypothetical protein
MSRRTLKLGALLGGEREHEVRAHQVQHRRFLEAGRRQCLPAYRSSHLASTPGTLGHQATSNDNARRDHNADFWLREDSQTVKTLMVRFQPQCAPWSESMKSARRGAPARAGAQHALRGIAHAVGDRRRQVFLKFENLQFTSSFKERGLRATSWSIFPRTVHAA